MTKWVIFAEPVVMAGYKTELCPYFIEFETRDSDGNTTQTPIVPGGYAHAVDLILNLQSANCQLAQGEMCRPVYTLHKFDEYNKGN